jgi:Cu(I)/Ag(I) efflux system membrane fusion protein
MRTLTYSNSVLLRNNPVILFSFVAKCKIMNFKVCVPVGLLMLSAAQFACNQQAPKEQEAPAAVSSVLQAPYSQVFYDSLGATMQSYYQLSDALVQADSTAANTAAAALKGHVDSLPVNLLQMDSSHLANITGITGSVSAELTGLAGETALEGKRAAFQMVSDMLFDLVKNTGLKGHTIYHQYCPMAFDDKGAYWLSDKAAIQNPYFGHKMLTCGETKDSLSYK